MNNTRLAGYVVLAVLMVIGCRGAAKGPGIPDYRLEIIRLNNTAEKAFRKGNYERALFLYGEALRQSRSVEDVESIAANLTNIALVYRKLGKIQEALPYVDEILESDNVQFSSNQHARAVEIKAALYVDEGRLEQAQILADEALTYCRSIRCGREGRIHNLRARIYFLQGRHDAALDDGMIGRELNAASKDRPEMANSIRIVADVMAETGRYSEAKGLYEEALVMDKELGLSGKIAADLRGLGRVHIGLEENDAALGYFRRALEVSEGSGDEGGRSEAAKMIDTLIENQ